MCSLIWSTHELHGPVLEMRRARLRYSLTGRGIRVDVKRAHVKEINRAQTGSPAVWIFWAAGKLMIRIWDANTNFVGFFPSPGELFRCCSLVVARALKLICSEAVAPGTCLIRPGILHDASMHTLIYCQCNCKRCILALLWCSALNI